MKKSIFTLFISVISIATFAINMVSTETKPFKLSIDHDSVRAYNGPETLTYSPFWSEEEGETAEITQNSETFLSKQTHEGDVVWQTSQDGVHYFEHKIRNASGEIIETETAAFAKNVGTEFYTVRFNANQGIGNMPNQIFAVNEAKALSKNTFTREGYKFVGWRKSPEYLVIDLSGGTSAASYPVTTLSEVPAGGWTDEYKTTKLVLRKITAGKMPCKDVDVTLTKDYYVGVFEVTQKQWELVMGSNPSYFDGDTLPVETVSYDDIRGTSNGSKWPASNAVDATSFMGKLRAKTGIDFDLPTVAQWEYACRAGSSGDYGLLADGTIGTIDQMGWYDENSGGITHIVGAKTPNAWGLYDMHGNVWEWCLDWSTSYSLNSGVDPVGPSTGKYRRLCGASHYDFKNMTPLNLRRINGSHWPYLKEKNDGLRVVAPTTFLSSIDDLSSEFLLDEQVVSNLSYLDGGVVDLYAVWEETYYYNVRFNANGGEGQMETQQFEKGEAKALSKNTFTREGYKFVGWGIKSEYLVVDLSGGTSATSYPVTMLPDVLDGGWTDEYKTTKLVLRKITAGKMPRTDVDITLTKDYYIGIFELTQKQWELVMGSNPSNSDGDTTLPKELSYDDIRGTINGSQWPASNAVDASSFMGKLRAKTGIDFDLPTSAQWEYACRAGSSGDWGLLADGSMGTLDEMGWYWDNSSSKTNLVGLKTPNAWGLYDMHGNVWEWCLDWYSEEPLNNGIDPKGPDSGTYRIRRGGSWSTKLSENCSAQRIEYNLPDGGDGIFGLRVVAFNDDLNNITHFVSYTDEQFVSNLSYKGGDIVDLYAVWELNRTFIEGEDGDYIISGYTNVYDGAAHSLSISVMNSINANITYSIDGNTFISEMPLFTNVCEQTVWYKLEAEGYIPMTNMAQVVIKPRSVTLTSGSASKVYDGTKLTKHEVAVSGDGFVAGEGASYAYTGSQTAAGSSDNAFSYTLNANTLASNYVITTVNGKLTVTKASVVDPESGAEPGDGTVPDGGLSKFDTSFVYDGEAHTINTNALIKAFEGAMIGDITVEYALDNGENAPNDETWSATPYAFTNVCEEVVWYRVQNENYNDFVHAAKVVITTRPVDVSVVGHTGEYTFDGSVKSVSGYDITTDDPLYDTADTTFSGTGSASRTDVGTSSLGLTATNFVNTNANFAVTYLITDGWVKINALNIESASATLEIKLATNPMYNGSEQTLAVESVSCNGLPVTYTVSGNKQTNAGAYTLTVAANGNFAGQKSMDWSILKRPVTLTSATKSWIYDGAVHSAESIQANGFVDGQGAEYSDFASILNVGSCDNTFKYALKSNTLASNYDIDVVNGKLNIEPRVVGDNSTNWDIRLGKNPLYDGEEKQAPITQVAYIKADGNLENVAYSLQGNIATNAGNYVVKITGTGNYTGTIERNWAITPRVVELTSNSGSWIYDGAEHSVKTVDASGDCFADGEGVVFANFPVVKNYSDASTPIENKFTYSFKEGTLARNYVITTKFGTLSMSRRPIILKSPTKSKPYDGEALSFDSSEIEAGGAGYASGECFTYGSFASIVDAGQIASSFAYNNSDTAKLDNYIVTTDIGTLTIAKSATEIVVQANSSSWVYDGQAHTNHTWTATNLETLQSGDKLLVVFDPLSVVTLPTDGKNGDGIVTNMITSVKVVRNDEIDVTANYSIAYYSGILAVTKRNVILTSAGASKPYDGLELMSNEVVVSGDGFVEGEGASYEFTGKQLEKGISENTFTYTLNANTLASNYDIEVKFGTLEITALDISTIDRAELKVVLGPALTYTGLEQNQTVASVSYNSLLVGYSVTGNQGTDAGNYNLSITGQGNFAGIIEWTWEILPKELKLTAGSGNKVYDGVELTIADVKAEGFVANQGATFTCDGSQTDVGSSANNVETIMWKANTKGSNYKVTKLPGVLTVTERAITLTAPTKTKPYDGTELSFDSSEIMIGGLGFVAGEGFSYSNYSSITEAGQTPSTFTYVADAQTKLSNYSITVVPGTLTIAKSATGIVVQAGSGSWQYDGQTHTNHTWTATNLDVLQSGDELVVEFDPLSVVALPTDGIEQNGIIENRITSVKVIRNGKTDVTANYSITCYSGTLTVTKRNVDVVIKGNNAEYIFDGTEKTIDGYQITTTDEMYDIATMTKFVGKSSISEINVGKYQMGLSATDFVNIDDLYNVTYNVIDGILIINALDISNATSSDFVVELGQNPKYNGVLQTIEVKSATYKNLPLTYTLTGDKATHSGQYLLTFTANGNFVGEQTISWEILKRSVTFTSASDTKVYDGTPLKNNKVTISQDGFIGLEGATFDVSGIQTNTGKSSNTFSYELKAGTLASDYDITCVEGDLTVTKASVVEPESGAEPGDGTVPDGGLSKFDTSFVYDGEAHTINTNALIKAFEGAMIGDITLEYALDNGENTPNDETWSATPYAFTNVCEEVVWYRVQNENYNDFVHAAKVVITPRPVEVSVVGHTAEYTFDGSVKSVSGYDITTDDPLYDTADTTFNGTGSVSRTNVGTSSLGLVATDFVNTNANFAVIYLVTDGWVKINALNIESASPSLEIKLATNPMYNGSEQTLAVESVSCNGLPVTYTVSGNKQTNAGNYTLTVTANGNFAGQKSMDWSILKCSVTLTSGSASKVYDGTPLTKHEVAVSGDGFVAGEGASYAYTGSQTAAGSSDNAFSYTLNANTLASNYVITTVNGKLTVTKASVVDPESGAEPGDGTVPDGGLSKFDTSFVYDGEAHTINTNALIKAFEGAMIGDITVEYALDNGENTPNDETWSAAPYAFTNVCEEVVWYRVQNENYNDFVHAAKVVITTRPVDVSVVGHTAEYTFDGSVKSVSGYDITTDDSLYDTADTTFSGTGSVSRIDVGTSSLGLTSADFVNTNANFAVTYLVTDGWVKINALNIESASASLEIKLAANPMYNGSEQTLAVESVSCNGLPVTYTVSGNKQTNAGAYTLTVAANGNFSGQKSMDWSILKRSVTLTSGSTSKIYDGTPLTKHEVAVSGDGFVAGEGASYAYTGSQTVAGSSDNAFSYTLNANTLASNYVITTVNGKLTITQSVIKPEDIFGSDHAETPLSCEKTYNGVAQPVEVVPEFDEEYTFLWSLNGENESSYLKTAPTLKNVADGELLVYFKMVTANFEPYYGKVIFKILPKELTEDMVVLTDEAFFFDPDSGQKTPSVTVADTLADGTVISTTADYEIAYGDSTSAGAIPVIVTAKNNYFGQITKTFDVLKRPVAPPVIGAKAYNGRTQKATITTDSRWKVVENNGGINAGEYDVVLRLTNTSDYMWKGLDNDAAEWTGVFVIRKGNNGWSRYPGINSWTSGETPSEPVGQPRYGELSIAYRRVGASIATETVTKPTAPGKYIARFWVDETDNFIGVATTEPYYEVEFEIYQGEGDVVNTHTQTTGIPVPYTWLEPYLEKYGSGDYEIAGNAKGANGYYLWESYLVGLDPEDPTSRFLANIEMLPDGMPKVSWMPDLSEAEEPRTYTVWGKEKLDDEEWTPVTPENKEELHFFKVTVEME